MWRPDDWDEMMWDKYGQPCSDWTDGYEAGADAMLGVLTRELVKHPIFWKNCKSQKKKPAKICLDCPFREARIIPDEEK